MNRYGVVMAGGQGTRFWPLSRQRTPKQVLNISGNDVMINETIKRCIGVIPFENTFVITNKRQEKHIKDVLLEVVPKENVLVEPAARNTAPCILYTALTLLNQYGDGVMSVFPADHYISDEKEFRQVLERAILLAERTDQLITIGIRPTFPSTGYGYIGFDDTLLHQGAYEVLEFKEKPNFDTASKYVDSGHYLWNSGIFVWKISVIIENFKRFLPRIYEHIKDFVRLEECYPKLQSISIDYGIMERSNEALVFPADFGWNDVGSWDSLGTIFPTDKNGNIVKADFLGIDTENSIIYGNGRLITTVGLKEMIVVNTKDALLICPKSRAQEVKKIVSKLREKERTEYL